MNKFQEIADKVNAAADKARNDKGTKSEEEIKADFMRTAVELFNEYVAGDVTLADGRILTTPKIIEI